MIHCGIRTRDALVAACLYHYTYTHPTDVQCYHVTPFFPVYPAPSSPTHVRVQHQRDSVWHQRLWVRPLSICSSHVYRNGCPRYVRGRTSLYAGGHVLHTVQAPLRSGHGLPHPGSYSRHRVTCVRYRAHTDARQIYTMAGRRSTKDYTLVLSQQCQVHKQRGKATRARQLPSESLSSRWVIIAHVSLQPRASTQLTQYAVTLGED